MVCYMCVYYYYVIITFFFYFFFIKLVKFKKKIVKLVIVQSFDWLDAKCISLYMNECGCVPQ